MTTGEVIAMNPIGAIAYQVCQKHRITLAQLRGKQRARCFAWPRQEVMYRASKETSASLPEIGRYLDRDHTTVIHGIRAHEARMEAACA